MGAVALAGGCALFSSLFPWAALGWALHLSFPPASPPAGTGGLTAQSWDHLVKEPFNHRPRSRYALLLGTEDALYYFSRGVCWGCGWADNIPTPVILSCSHLRAPEGGKSPHGPLPA